MLTLARAEYEIILTFKGLASIKSWSRGIRDLHETCSGPHPDEIIFLKGLPFS